MEWLTENWNSLLILVLLIVGLIKLLMNDKAKAKEWLLWACLEAEKQFGSKTGSIKLRYVYDAFLTAFPLLSKFISFEQFGAMVDEALVQMKHLINTNMRVFEYVGGYDEDLKN